MLYDQSAGNQKKIQKKFECDREEKNDVRRDHKDTLHLRRS